jgi:hypothetical protein
MQNPGWDRAFRGGSELSGNPALREPAGTRRRLEDEEARELGHRNLNELACTNEA